MNKHMPKKGVYTPKNMNRYTGNSLPVYRSSWELKAFIALDRNDKILRWGSENIVIPYIDKTRNNEYHRYIVDLFFELADVKKDGRPIKWLIEIKPENQSVQKTYRKNKSPEKALAESIIIARNKCKWEAAVGFCKAKGWHFGVYTENGINKLC